MTERARIRRRAEELLQSGEARYWSEAIEKATREVRRSPSESVEADDVAEAAGRLFGELAEPEVGDEELAEAADRLFGRRSAGNLSEAFRDRQRGGNR